MKTLLLRVSTLVFALAAPLLASHSLSDRSLGATSSEVPYQAHFERYAAQYLPELDWLWFAGQGFAESSFRTHVTSPAGARGLMQIRPATWDETAERIGDDCSPWNARCSIKYGIHYDSRLYRSWSGRGRFPSQIIGWMFAGYNYGNTATVRAQARCGDPLEYYQAIPCLPAETVNYVRRIADYRRDQLRDTDD